LAPPTFLSYLETYWMPEYYRQMWSAIFRTEEDIFLASDTNMLIEAWHHVLKSMFLKGKRNRRLDFLLHVLIEDVVPYFRLRERRQIDKFEGLEADMRCRRDIRARCEKEFTVDDIQVSHH
ncbi:hypothetical protein C8J56DRAFT_751129, partial [Mycena floridula]